MATTTARKTPGRTMSPAQIEQMKAREEEVMALRTSGMSFSNIDKRLGMKNSWKVFQRAIARNDNIEYRRAEAIRLEESRLDAMQEGIWGRVLAGEPRAVEVALKVLERRARLLGLDFADLVNSKTIEIEQERLRMVGTALQEAFREGGASDEVVARIVPLFYNKVRELGDQKLVGSKLDPNVVHSEVVPDDGSDLL